jgi:hypothetical protein
VKEDSFVTFAGNAFAGRVIFMNRRQCLAIAVAVMRRQDQNTSLKTYYG